MGVRRGKAALSMEVTKWLKPSVSVSRYAVTARVCRPLKRRANAEKSPGLHHARRAPVGTIALCPLRRAGLSQGAGSAACSG
jgi:hypothetical protein